MGAETFENNRPPSSSPSLWLELTPSVVEAAAMELWSELQDERGGPSPKQCERIIARVLSAVASQSSEL